KLVGTEPPCCGKAIQNPYPVTLATFSPDGRRLFAAGSFENLPVTTHYYGAALLWDLDIVSDWPPQQLIEDILTIGDAAAFSPDGTRLALSTHRSAPPWAPTVHVWDLNTRQVTLALDENRGPVAFSPDGKWLLTGQYEDPTAQLWDAQ